MATEIREEIKGNQIGKKERKLSLFINHMIIYVESLMESIKKTIISEFSKVI